MLIRDNEQMIIWNTYIMILICLSTSPLTLEVDNQLPPMSHSERLCAMAYYHRYPDNPNLITLNK